MVEQYGIRWILVNNWGGEGFETRTFAANLPNGVLFKTADRLIHPEDLAHLDLHNIALEFVPGIRVLADDAPSGEWPAIEEQTDLVLDPRFLRDSPPADLDVSTLGDSESTFIPREPRIRLDEGRPELGSSEKGDQKAENTGVNSLRGRFSTSPDQEEAIKADQEAQNGHFPFLDRPKGVPWSRWIRDRLPGRR